MNEIRHINGLYALWDALLARFPGLIIDNCASGGRRIDIETLRRSVPLWRSDYQCVWDADAEATQTQHMAIAYWLPHSGTGNGFGIGDTYKARSCYSSSFVSSYWAMRDENRVRMMRWTGYAPSMPSSSGQDRILRGIITR
jgi:alpha-galactosidase